MFQPNRLFLIPNSDLNVPFCSKSSRGNDRSNETASIQLKPFQIQKWIHSRIELLAANRFGICDLGAPGWEEPWFPLRVVLLLSLVFVWRCYVLVLFCLLWFFSPYQSMWWCIRHLFEGSGRVCRFVFSWVCCRSLLSVSLFGAAFVLFLSYFCLVLLIFSHLRLFSPLLRPISL